MRMLILGTGSATGEWKKANVTHLPKTWNAHLCRTKRGLPKVECHKAEGGKSAHMAKGNSESISKQKGWCARHYEKSDSCLEKP